MEDKKSFSFDYAIGDAVSLVINGRKATVIGLFVNRQGLKQYNVEWPTDTGAVNTDWVYPEQITAA